ncbi:MAG: hypothetical protein QGF59_27980 [Pirellulaceae bacterium]|nr:hypothetical protein [Pirellulaceae bacterium]
MKDFDFEGIALAGFEGDVRFLRFTIGQSLVDNLAVDFHGVVRRIAGAALHSIDAVLRNFKQPVGDGLVGRRAVRFISLQLRDFVVANFVNLKRALGRGGIGAEVDTGVNVLRAAEVAHPDHVGLTGEDVDLDGFRGVAGFAIGVGEFGGNVRGVSGYLYKEDCGEANQ